MFCSMYLDDKDKNETALRGLNFVGIEFHVYFNTVKSC